MEKMSRDNVRKEKGKTIPWDCRRELAGSTYSIP